MPKPVDSEMQRTAARKISLRFSPLEVASAFHNEDHFVFLDSSRVDEEQGRYSVLAWKPELVFRAKGKTVEIRVHGEWRQSIEDPIEALARLLAAWRLPKQLPNGMVFGAGAIGYLAYDLFSFIERYDSLKAADDLGLPDCYLGFYDMVLIFDHQRSEWTIAGASHDPEGIDLEKRFEQRRSEIQSEVAASLGFNETLSSPLTNKSLRAECNMTKEEYVAAVRKALDYIGAGDIYQVNLSQRFSCGLNAAPFDLFRALRNTNPSSYGAYLNCEDHTVISASPELFLFRQGSILETRPIKGTRPRGQTVAEDERLKNELLASDKEAAELAMIVDLERNDLGRVCEYGSVEVVQHRYVDELPTLFHTISIVRGKVRIQADAIDILRATFPGGSISGCPKIRAIEIIDELEPTCRHVYTGAIGFIGFDGNMALNIAIRTILVAGNRLHYQVGSGIVADSVPEKEYAETLDKAYALRRAISAAGQSANSQSASRPGARANAKPQFLAEKTLLHPSIHPKGARTKSPETVLLTGATGFLGANLLHELLTRTSLNVLCLVRARDVREGESRIRRRLNEQHLGENDLSRVHVVIGDLTKPWLGLSAAEFAKLAEQVDLIYHAAARVNIVYPYSVLAEANVAGTEEILRLASLGPPSAVHAISTLAVFSSSSYACSKVIKEQFEAPVAGGLIAPYAQTKWASEHLLNQAAERGLPTWIYRPGVITSHSQTGACNLGDRLTQLLRACIRWRFAPEMDGTVYLTPVDYVSRAIVALSMDPGAAGQAFHLINSEALSWSEILDTIRQMGYELNTTPYTQWLKEIRRLGLERDDKALLSLAGLLLGHQPFQRNKERHFDCHNTLASLRQRGVSGVFDGRSLLRKWLMFLDAAGAVS